MLKHWLGNIVLAAVLTGGLTSAQAAPLKPAPSAPTARVGVEGESPEQKLFQDKADAALKALDEKMERRNQAARRAMSGICTGCSSRSAVGTASPAPSTEGGEYDPFAGSVSEGDGVQTSAPIPGPSVGSPQVAQSQASAQVAPAQAVQPRRATSQLAPPMSILPDLAR